ncbi:hypothetical protein EJB05_54455, partial [Eragrostis curvula]
MESEQRQPSAPSPAEAMAAAAAMSLVLGDDNLLGEILLRLAFPTYLVRAALACKRWLRVASSPAFLRHFRSVHPPRLLGFYANGGLCRPSEFWPARHPPELASAVRRAASLFDAFPCGRWLYVMRSREDGCLLVSLTVSSSFIDAVFSPLLYPGRDGVILPSSSLAARKSGIHCSCSSFVLLPEHSNDDLQGLKLLQIFRDGKPRATVRINVFQNGEWGLHTSVVTKLLENSILEVMENGNKVYITTKANIFVWDLVSSTCSVIDYPDEFHRGFDMGLLWKVNDSGVYLIKVIDESQLRIWLHRTVNGNLGDWVSMDTICLNTVFTGFGMPVGSFKLRYAGENSGGQNH